jgi:MFS family permease
LKEEKGEKTDEHSAKRVGEIVPARLDAPLFFSTDSPHPPPLGELVEFNSAKTDLEPLALSDVCTRTYNGGFVYIPLFPGANETTSSHQSNIHDYYRPQIFNSSHITFMVAGPTGSSDGDEVYKNLSNNCHASWYRDPGLRRLNIGILLVFSSATANGFDGSLMNGLLAIPAFKEDLVDRVNTSILGLIIAAISIGGLVALIPAGYVSDKWGRKPCLAIGTSLMIATSIVQAFTSGPWAFIATKIILGVGIAFILIPAPALATETAHPRNRGMVTACFQTAFYWGAIVSAVATLGGLYIKGSWAWRMPVMMQILFPSLQILGLFIIPESPRFLIANGRKEKALEILARFHANGDQHDALVVYEYSEICEALEREAAFATCSTWKLFIATPGNRHRLLICLLVGVMIQWAGNGIGMIAPLHILTAPPATRR